MLLSDQLVKGEHFEDPVDEQIFLRLTGLYHELKVPPTLRVVAEELREDLEPDEFSIFFKRLKQIKKLKVSEADRRFIEREVRRFVGLQAIKLAMTKSINALKKGNLRRVRHLLRQSLDAGDAASDLIEIDYFADVAERYADGDLRIGHTGVVKTLIGDLDHTLRGGGMLKREIGVVLAVPNMGKSMALCHLAKAAVLQRYNVVYVSLDDDPRILAERLDGSFTGIRLTDLPEQKIKAIAKVDRFGRTYGNRLIFKEFLVGTGAEGVAAYLDRLAARGFKPDVVIIDYVNLMSHGSRDAFERYKELGNVFESLKKLAKERDVLVWTAAQSSRAGYNKELVTAAEIAESFEGIMAANVILSLNATPEEKRREAMRLYVVKNKTSIAEVTVRITTNYSKGAFYRKFATGGS